MAHVRLTTMLLGAVAAATLAGCAGSGHRAATTAVPAGPVDVSQAGARTVGPGTARFTYDISGAVGGLAMRTHERGTVAFVLQQAHIYKLLTSGGIPQEIIVDGPYVYGNGNVQAALNDPSVKPWTRLDTRRLSAEQRRAQGDELAHIRAPAYLIEGVAVARRVGGSRLHLRGIVDPHRLEARVPVAIRSSIAAAVAADFSTTPFPADFWLDAKGRVRRVRVSYATKTGGRILVDAIYSGFGAPVPLGLPSAAGTTDISP
jgi:hypothetical protein